MNLDRIDEIIANNITITDKSLYEGVFNAVLEVVEAEREACAKVCDGWLHANGDDCAAAIRARGEV